MCRRRFRALVAAQIASRFGYKTPVVLRTTDQLADVHAGNPFLPMGATEETLHVLFLADHPTPAAVAVLDPERSPGDTYLVRGRDVYLRLPNGAGTSRLTNAYFDSKLATMSTGRNWRTVTKLLEMMKA